MEKNNIIITALCIITTISLSSCIEDGDMEDFKENNNAVASVKTTKSSSSQLDLHLNGEYEFGENIDDYGAVVFSDNLKEKWFCLVGGPGTHDITFQNDYPSNLNTREYVFDDHKISQNVSFTMGIPGKWYLSAYAVNNDTIYAKAEGEICVNYPSSSTIISECSFEIDNLWRETIQAANKEGREEKGCWIYTYLRNGSVSFNFGNTESGPFVDYGENTHGSIVPSILKETYPDNFENLEKGEYAVAYIHAHTPVAPAGKYAGLKRRTGPSEEDKIWTEKWGIPLMTIDYSTFEIRSEDPIDSPTTVYVTGPSSRIINK